MMIRILFLTTIVILLQVFTYIAARGLGWWLPLSPKRCRRLMIACFVIGNLFLVGLFVGAFRLTLGYLSILWVLMMAMAVGLGVYCLLKALKKPADRPTKIITPLVFIGLILSGIYHAYTPTVKYLSLTLDKPMPTDVRIALVSDLHLGAMVGSRQLDKLAKLLTDEHVDVLLMPGDIMDDDVIYYHQEGMESHFADVVASAPAAVSSLGNHDIYRAHAQDAIIQAIQQAGSILLDDKVTTITVSKGGLSTPLTIIGRIDDHDKSRATTAELVAMADVSHPVILLDHRPSQLETNSRLPIDLQLSGHTHRGQVFPANLIANAINRIGYGYDKVGDMHAVVTSGYGFWGVPLRIGSQAEIWIIDLSGQSSP
ncbi:metallophosphoesterase [Moraxella catarrhalis]|uniref:Phosphoesterase n=1 Tax=Moraxella catarrhalis TaxID=480 RepID=A0A198UK54_MORCA|nr:metallophosphoesterase [Moraxella catarrhalis]OAU96489.1 Phosphoesterase [Moraxella catarrhalis]OAU96659.1 Phosphoesterase [Moraxella catarrhalis]OAV03786.1 Phosphoesterase [Moraxella catarrhalis]